MKYHYSHFLKASSRSLLLKQLEFQASKYPDSLCILLFSEELNFNANFLKIIR